MFARKNIFLKKGFTLLEILLVIGIIAVMAGIVIIAINPGHQLAKARDSERRSGITEINKAIVQYYIDEGEYPPGITLQLKSICLTGDSPTSDGFDCDGLVDLSMLVPDYLSEIPADPLGESYLIGFNLAGNTMLVASHTEVTPPLIAVGTTTISSYTLPDICTSFTYSDWSTCTNNVQTRTIVDETPDGCTGGGPELSQSCVNSYVITFDENGGTGSIPQQTIASGTTATLTVNSNLITRNGYAFAGWATSAQGVVEYTDGYYYTMHGANVTLYAVWTANLSVTYHANHATSGSIPTDSTVYHSGDIVTVLDNVNLLQRTNYTFAGWNTADDGSGTNQATSSTFAIGASSVILYAKWIANQTYTMTYNGNGNTGGSVPSDATAYFSGATATVLGNTGVLVKTGYTFDGWNTVDDGSGIDYASSSSLIIGSANVVLYAKWLSSGFTSFIEVNKIQGLDSNTSDYFGNSVGISGDYAIIATTNGTPAGDNAGSAYIFKRNTSNGSFEEVNKIVASDSTASDYFGGAVAISGDYAVVGAALDDTVGVDTGSFYVFKKNQSTGIFEETQKIVTSDIEERDRIASAISIDGDYILVGARCADSTDDWACAGSAYIFKRNINTGLFEELQKVRSSDIQYADEFGGSVSISGDYLAISAPRAVGTAGAVYFFKKNTGSGLFEEVNKVTASDAAGGDFFGHSIAMSGDYTVIGAWSNDVGATNAGSIYIIKRNISTGIFEQQSKIQAPNRIADGNFGYQVSISGDYVVVGSKVDDTGGVDAGATYILRKNTTTELFEHLDKIQASDLAAYDYFGHSVSISDNYIVVGARGEDTGGSNTGAAYIFRGI